MRHRARAGWHAGKSIDNITNFTENRASKFLFFSRLKRDVFFNFCVIKKMYQENITFVKPIHMFSLKA